jgi:uncharacterized protein
VQTPICWVLLDATFARREDRSLFGKLAQRLGVVACLIQCQARDAVLVSRINERALQGQDASEADVTVLNWQKEHWQPVAANEGWSLMSADSTTELDELARRVRLLQG